MASYGYLTPRPGGTVLCDNFGLPSKNSPGLNNTKDPLGGSARSGFPRSKALDNLKLQTAPTVRRS